MPTRWARTARCALTAGVSVLVVLVTGPPAVGAALVTGTAGSGPPARAQVARATPGPALSLVSQTSWVGPDQPWFNLGVAVGPSAGPASALRVNVAFYGRIDDASQLQQDIGGTFPGAPLLRLDDLPVSGAGGTLGVSTCVTVLPEPGSSVPVAGDGACAAGSPTLSLGCRPLTGTCGDVYPVAVSLQRDGASTPVAHFTTFLTYEEPTAVGQGGPLRVGLVVPVGTGGLAATAAALAAHREVPTTLSVSPAVVETTLLTRPRAGMHALEQLGGLATDQVLEQPYVPVNMAALAEAGISGEIQVQTVRGDEVLRDAGLKPAGSTWVDAASSFSQGDGTGLATGLRVSGAGRLVLSDADLATGNLGDYTFAQPFTLDLGHGATVPAAAADSSLDARFTAQPSDPVLGAEQLLASLSFVHFENAFLSQARGVVVVPPSAWQPSAAFLDALLGGLSGNPALSAVTLDQLFAQVPAGGNHEPSVRRLQAGAAGHGITRSAAERIALDRQQLASFSAAVSGHPPALEALSDALLDTEARRLSTPRRATVLSSYAKAFDAAIGQITLATERTVTFTAQRAAIPVTILSAAPYPVTVVVTLTSDKFTFPNGQPPPVTLVRPTTSVRVEAQARTSGDRLPIDVTLHTPNGQLLLAHTVLTVHSTSISFVGVALTALAGAVLLVWWVRTWRRTGRRRRPRARPQAD